MNYIEEVRKLNSDRTYKALINTYGCQQNENDSEKIAGLLQEMGYGFTDSETDADLIIFNTCAIRENAEKKFYGSLGAIKILKEMRPNMIIAVSGCMTGQEHVVKRIKSTYKQVDVVLSANNYKKLPELIYNARAKHDRFFDTTYEDKVPEEGIPVLRTDKIKAGLPIMYGCNNFCAYCIVPYVRGRERSRSEEEILKDARRLVDEGYKEIMLLGQNVNSYNGGGDNFARLLEKVSDTGIERIRFMTSHPKDISDRVLDVMAERENICKCLHLPLQSGSNKILKAMNRKYTREKYLEIVDKAKSKMPGIALTTDIIVGFPGETTADFEDTLDILEKVRYDMIYSFIFSPRKGTPAYSMEDVITAEEKKANFDRMLEVQNRISLEKNLELRGKTVPVLVEGVSKTKECMLTGRTEGGKIVNFPGDKSLSGQIINVKLNEAKTWNFVGERID